VTIGIQQRELAAAILAILDRADVGNERLDTRSKGLGVVDAQIGSQPPSRLAAPRGAAILAAPSGA
jgi:hypothetical protein